MRRTRTLTSFCRALITSAAVFVLIIGCSNALNYEVAALTEQQRIRVQRALTADQLKDLDDWIIRKSMGNNYNPNGVITTLSPGDRNRWLAKAGKNLPRGVTVEQALRDQDEWVNKQKIDEVRKAERIKAGLALRATTQANFARMLSVALISKRNEVHRDDKKYVVLDLSYENKSDKSIIGVEGVLKLADTYGRPVADINWTYQGAIPPKQVAVERGVEININKSSEELAGLWATDFEKLTLAFDVKLITFNNGQFSSASADGT